MTKAHKKEVDFIQRVDCKFPYHNFSKAAALIEEAKTVSDNSLFKVVEELVRIPESKNSLVSTDILIQLLDQSFQNYTHPLIEIIYPICLKMIMEEKISSLESISAMLKVKEYLGQYAALSIIYHAAASTTPQLEGLHEEIIQDWKTKANP